MAKNKFIWLVLGILVVSAIALGSRAGLPISLKTFLPAKPTNLQALPSLAFNPADGSLLKADAGGLARLAADGKKWDVIQTPASSLTGIVLNPDNPATLYLSDFNVGVFKSTDNGGTWSKINNGLPRTEISALALHSFRRETLYVWVNGEGIYRTEDGGANWKQIPDQGPPDRDVSSLAHSTLPGSMNTGWLYASTPSGAYLSMDCF